MHTLDCDVRQEKAQFAHDTYLDCIRKLAFCLLLLLVLVLWSRSAWPFPSSLLKCWSTVAVRAMFSLGLASFFPTLVRIRFLYSSSSKLPCASLSRYNKHILCSRLCPTPRHLLEPAHSQPSSIFLKTPTKVPFSSAAATRSLSPNCLLT